MDTAAWYRWFGENEASGSSVQYERLAAAVAEDPALIGWLNQLPAQKRQPNLLFASVRFLGGPTARPHEFAQFVLDDSEAVSTVMMARSTQTNEAARCGAFLPVLAQIDGPVALLEIGASAGLCLHPDRYSYSYNRGPRIGRSNLHLDIRADGPFPQPTRLPDVTWRAGLDLNPLDVQDAEDVEWLRACIWPEHDHRRARLDDAISIAARNPVRIVTGDLATNTMDLLAQAPDDAMKVLFHSAVLNYVEHDRRQHFIAEMTAVTRGRSDLVWLSNEGPDIIAGLTPPNDLPNPATPRRSVFHLGRNGRELLALTDPHGASLTWIDLGE